MKINLYTIFDRLAEEAGPVFQAKTDAVAVRNFRAITKEVSPEEVRLYCVGEFDNEKVMLFGLNGRPREILVPELGTKKEEA